MMLQNIISIALEYLLVSAVFSGLLLRSGAATKAAAAAEAEAGTDTVECGGDESGGVCRRRKHQHQPGHAQNRICPSPAPSLPPLPKLHAIIMPFGYRSQCVRVFPRSSEPGTESDSTLGVCFLLYAVDSTRESVSFGRFLFCERARQSSSELKQNAGREGKSSLIAVQSTVFCCSKVQAICCQPGQCVRESVLVLDLGGPLLN